MNIFIKLERRRRMGEEFNQFPFLGSAKNN
jgi:hypothetical protein